MSDFGHLSDVVHDVLQPPIRMASITAGKGFCRGEEAADSRTARLCSKIRYSLEGEGAAALGVLVEGSRT